MVGIFPSKRMQIPEIFFLILFSAAILFSPPSSVQAGGGDRFYTLKDSSRQLNSSGNSSEAAEVPRTLHMASLNPETCITYEPSTILITITCSSASLTEVNKVLHNPSILKSEGNDTWILNANLSIASGANFTINSNDTKWLKINSTTSPHAYHIEVLGNLKIDSVKISSWNTSSNTYPETDGKIHRASIAIPAEATGSTHISNSEISHLGYSASPYQGLSFLGGDGSTIRNNTIHDLWYGFYSNGRANMVIENNDIYANTKYGIDPHTGTHDIIIRSNKVHDNDGLGVVCSDQCKNIMIEGNEIYRNKIGGVLLSRNVINSTVRNNAIHDEIKSIAISESHENNIYGNKILGADVAIETKAGSSKNNIFENDIINPRIYGINIVKDSKANVASKNNVTNPVEYGICVHNSALGNQILENKIIKSGRDAICVTNEASNTLVKSNMINTSSRNGIHVADTDSKNNTFINNMVHDSKVGIWVDNNTGSIFRQNSIGGSKDTDFSISKNSVLKIENSNFTSDKISPLGVNASSVHISKSGTIVIKDNANSSNQTTVDTDKTPYFVRLADPDSITVTTIK